MRTAFILAAIVAFACGSLPAQENGPIELTLTPRAIESPALKYRLYPAEAEIRPGDAVPILLRMPWEQMPWMTNEFPKLHEWDSRPLDAPEWQNSGGVLPGRFYDEMKRAAYRRDALWEYPLHETQTPYLIMLPDVQGLRGFLGHGLSARIRYHLSRGELDQAREGILVGLANGRHLAQTPFFVNQLVAAAIHQIMLKRTDELISQPGSPNLYWALSTLPDSLLELDRAADLEGSVFAMTFPAAKDLDRPRKAEEWSKMAEQLLEVLREIGELPKEEPGDEGSIFSQLLQRLNPLEEARLAMWAPQARAELPQLLKITKEQAEAMSDDEAALRWYMHLRFARDQRIAAVLVLPPREAWPQLKTLQDEMRSLQEKTGAKGYEFFNPDSIYITAWSLKRKIAALRIIEAVRHHLLVSDGRLPESLSQIQALPIPFDPMTDQPFQWTVKGEAATLKAPPLPGDVVTPGSATAKSAALEYRLHVHQ
jgi:hypothetical protein